MSMVWVLTLGADFLGSLVRVFGYLGNECPVVGGCLALLPQHELVGFRSRELGRADRSWHHNLRAHPVVQHLPLLCVNQDQTTHH